MVARNFRTTRHHGEIDLIGWAKDVLCFIEVEVYYEGRRQHPTIELFQNALLSS